MKIYAKTNYNKDEILYKKTLKCDGFEINLEENFMKYTKQDIDMLEKFFKVKDTFVIHTPKIDKYDYITIEDIVLGSHEDVLDNCFYMAEKIAKIYSHRILIVIHCTLSYRDFMEWKFLQNRIQKILNTLFFKYPNVDIAIENVICMETKLNNSFRLTNGTMLDSANIVEYLHYIFGERVGSVIDICHAKIANKQWIELLKISGFERNYTLEDYFSLNKNICKLIHFANMKGTGYGKGHGTGFDNIEEVKEIMNLYNKYKYTCPLTLEIREENYLKCDNYIKTRNLLQELGY